MPFMGPTLAGPRNHGVKVPHIQGQFWGLSSSLKCIGSLCSVHTAKGIIKSSIMSDMQWRDHSLLKNVMTVWLPQVDVTLHCRCEKSAHVQCRISSKYFDHFFPLIVPRENLWGITGTDYLQVGHLSINWQCTNSERDSTTRKPSLQVALTTLAQRTCQTTFHPVTMSSDLDLSTWPTYGQSAKYLEHWSLL